MRIENLLQGETIKITALNRVDAGVMKRWYEDVAFLRLENSMAAIPKTEEEIQRRIDAANESADEIGLAIRLIESEELIGTISFSEIEWSNQVSELGIGIGDRNNWRKGYGFEAMTIAMDFAFNELQMHRLQLTVLDYNLAAIALYEKCQFKREGVHREFFHRDGRRRDMYLYGLLRSEWKSEDGE